MVIFKFPQQNQSHIIPEIVWCLSNHQNDVCERWSFYHKLQISSDLCNVNGHLFGDALQNGWSSKEFCRFGDDYCRWFRSHYIYIHIYIHIYIYIYTGIIMHIFQNSPCHYKEWCRCLLLELSLLGRISSISMDNSSPPKMPQIVISWVGRLLDKGKACGLSLGCRWIRQWQLKKNGVFTSKHWPCNQVI